jgi:long-chain fatty acid transport protein
MQQSLLRLGLFAASMLSVLPSRASGFLIYDLSGEAIGRASAVSADVTEPAANWFNPAALAYMNGVSASAGGVFVTARSHFTANGTGDRTSSERGNFVLPALFAQGKLSKRVTLGMGVYSAFGIGVSWPRDWAGREAAISASLVTLSFNPNVAVRLSRKLSLAVGFDAIRSTVDFQNGLPSIVGGDVRLVGGAWGVGLNAAALYRVVPDRLHVALTYRSRVKLDYDGRADFTPGNPDFSRSLADQPGRAQITVPDIITAGVMGRATDELKLTFDAQAVLWSTYKEVHIDFASSPDHYLRPHGHDSFTLRAGADYLTSVPGFHVRGGLIFDRGALPATGLGPALPDSDRVDVTVGVGHDGRLTKLDLGYMLVMFLPAKAKSGVEGPEGEYRTRAHLVGFTAGVHF